MKSKEYWQRQIQQGITRQNPAIDVEFGPVYDTTIQPLSLALEELSANLDQISRIVDLSRWPEWTDAEMDAVAGNYGLTRRGGTRATGTVLFISITRPTQNISIPRNTVVSTQDGIRFRVITDVEVGLPAMDAFKNTVTGRYEIPAQIEALEIGTRANVAAGSILVVEGRRVLGVNNVINRISTKGGADKESNEHLVTRIRMLVQGGVGGTTVNGLRLRLLQAFDGVIESVEVETEKPIVDGVVDVWFVGSRLVAAEERTFWFGMDIVLTNGPVTDISRVISGGREFVRGTDWLLVRDESSAFARTSRSRDIIRWISLNRPAFGSEVVVTYTRNRLLDDIEEWQRQDYNRVLGMELAYREGIERLVQVEANVVLVTGFGTEVRGRVRTALFQFINSRKLGESLEVSDLILAARSVLGVDNIVFTRLSFLGETGVRDLLVTKSSYVRVLLDNIIIR